MKKFHKKLSETFYEKILYSECMNIWNRLKNDLYRNIYVNSLTYMKQKNIKSLYYNDNNR